jgi:hypothetical protein
MSYLEDTIDWQIVESVDRWLDEEVSQEYRDQPLAQDWARVAKVIEELGETIDAMIGFTGQNPRKGVVYSKEDMLYEIADTALTAIFALHHFTKNSSVAREILRRKQEFIYRRMMDLEEKK